MGGGNGMTGRTEAHLISRYRNELMGFAMLWVMLFHCFNIHISQPVLHAFKAIGLDTAKAVLGVDKAELIKRVDLEEETIDEVIAILAAEFED